MIECCGGHLETGRHGARGELCHRVHADVAQARDLAAIDARDEREVVARREHALGRRAPAAVCAIECGVGRFVGGPVALERLERLLQAPVVVPEGGGVVLLLGAVSEYEAEVIGAARLHGLEHLRIGAELEEEVRLGGAGELCVAGFVVVVAE